MPSRLKAWLQELDVQEMNVNLGFVSFKIGRRKPATSTGDAGTKAIDPPQQQEPDLDRDLPPDPLLADEPELTVSELDRPVSLEGTAFEQQLRASKEVADRLKHKRDDYVASKAVTFFLNGIPKGNDYERGRTTWRRIRAECLELILDNLDQHEQRATYGAVAGVVGVLARSVMSGKPKNPRNSWVVSVRTKLPTGYSNAERHTKLAEHAQVLETPNALREWLRSPG